MADHLTPEERDQILQTIEMFEAVTQSSPDDYQSLEILKEAYWKIGNQEKGLAVTRRLADAYMRLGQYSSALLEYEGILQQEPDSKEVAAIVEELDGKLHSKKSAAKGAPIALDFGVEETPIGLSEDGPGDLETWTPETAPGSGGGGSAGSAGSPGNGGSAEESTLIATTATKMPRNMVRRQLDVSLETDGNEPLAKFLIQHRLVTHEIVNAALERVREHNASPEVKEGKALADSLLNQIGNSGVEIETLLSGIVDRTKFAFIPLEYYDVDRQIVKMLPEHLTLGRLVVPFDIISRTMMIAVDNPFDLGAKTAVQQTVDYHIQWHLAYPHVLQKILRGAYRLTE